MGLLAPASDAGYLKAGFLGFAGSGKTHTAVELAIGVREFFGLTGPIAMFDTETGSDHWGARVKERTRQPLMVKKARSLTALLAVTEEAFTDGVSVLIVDSISHVWEEVQRSYLADLQAEQRRKGRMPSTRLEFQDWSSIKGTWAAWPTLYLNVPLHIIVCGRAGFEYDFETNERGKKELIKTGIKMKAEAEFGFEPSLVVEMERDLDHDNNALTIWAHVIKDRTHTLNGQSFKAPTFETFRPHVETLKPAAHTPIDASMPTRHYVNEAGRNPQRDEREVLAELIQHEMIKRWPSQTGADKVRRANAMERCFGSGSWKEVTERLSVDLMRAGLAKLSAEPVNDADQSGQ